jgi:hypothetical protein
MLGVKYAHRAISGLRRYLLRATRYHLYFVYNDEVVDIISIWGATRQGTPRFAHRASSTQAALAAAPAPGFVNRYEQEVVRVVDAPGIDDAHRVHEMRCRRCDHRYGSSAADAAERRCPHCQGGAPGLTLA